MITADPEVTFERIELDQTSWVDVARGWVADADDLFEALYRDVPWRANRLFRYDHWVEENRLGAVWSRGMPLPHPALADLHRALQRRYKVEFSGFSLLQYRNGHDGQAFHRDTDMKWLDDTIVAIVTLGARRPWLLRPKSSRYDLSPGKGATHDIAPGPGDLHVMGGRCQADWEHSVPVRPREPLGVRISLQWRYARRTGRPFMGTAWGAPQTYRRSR